jgi:hypothetical protein
MWYFSPHSKNVSLMHLEQGSALGQLYDAVPNLFQEGLVTWNMAMAINDQFDHRRLSVESLLAEIESWALISAGRATVIVLELLKNLDHVTGTLEPPAGVSPGMVERVRWTTQRLLAGVEIGRPKKR